MEPEQLFCEEPENRNEPAELEERAEPDSALMPPGEEEAAPCPAPAAGPPGRMEQLLREEAGRLARDYGVQAATPQEVLALPGADEIIRRMQAGLSLSDAYYLANRAEVDRQRQAAAVQQAMNALRATSHLQAVGAGAAQPEGEDIPAGALELWRDAFPGETDEELRQRYNRAL